LIFEPSWCFGRQTGAASQHVGAGASQQTGAGSQQASFLWNKPAEALDDEQAAATTTAKVIIIRRMELTPKVTKFRKPRRFTFLVAEPIRDFSSCHHSLMAVDAKSVEQAFPSEKRIANPGCVFYPNI
jgi:hypothetical protein